MLPAAWKPTPAEDLLRLGPDTDGGYFVSAGALEGAKLLVSMGLNDDWRFEADFRRRSGARVVCFDHSVTGHFWAWHALHGAVRLSPARATRYLRYRRFFAEPGVEHRRLKVGYDGPGGVSLPTILAEFGDMPIFLKIDIEGSEYRLFEDIVRNADRFTGLVLELHDIDLHRDRITAFLAALDAFSVVHLNANNFGGADAAGDPLVIEVSLTRIDLLRTGNRPAKLEQRANNPLAPDIPVLFESA